MPRMMTAAFIALCQPVLFAPGVISTPDNERSAAFTPDGDTVYFVKRSPEPYYSVICVSARVNGQWGTPRVAEFSGRYNDTDPAISPDGRDFVFTSTRSGGGASLDHASRRHGGMDCTGSSSKSHQLGER
jgi:Tol biopolymer transport system component